MLGAPVRFQRILDAVAEEAEVSVAEILGLGRQPDIVEARQVVVYLANKVRGDDLGVIGRKLGQDHSTMMHGVRVIERRRRSDPRFATHLASLEASLSQQSLFLGGN